MTSQVTLHLSPAIRTTGDRFIAEIDTSVHIESESQEDSGANAPLERTHMMGIVGGEEENEIDEEGRGGVPSCHFRSDREVDELEGHCWRHEGWRWAKSGGLRRSTKRNAFRDSLKSLVRTWGSRIQDGEDIPVIR